MKSFLNKLKLVQKENNIYRKSFKLSGTKKEF